jgi:hypothetical protein
VLTKSGPIRASAERMAVSIDSSTFGRIAGNTMMTAYVRVWEIREAGNVKRSRCLFAYNYCTWFPRLFPAPCDVSIVVGGRD